MEVAASAIAFVGFGLEATKTLYEVLSALRDGPDAARRAARSLAQLQTVLGRVERSDDVRRALLRLRANASAPPAAGTNNASAISVAAGVGAAAAAKPDALELAEHVQSCADELRFYEAKVGKLAVRDDERAMGRFWKRLRVVFSEKDLEKMAVALAGHASVLGLHLDALQRYAD